MTVNQAFEQFMKEHVNLDPDVVAKARASRDNLKDNIAEFNNAEDFFHLYPDIDIQFGSFARKTKCRELDDIDLMIGISADKATYTPERKWDDIRIMASASSAIQQQCKDEYGYLNSRKVLNVFKKKLMHVREYSRSEIKRNQQAVVLNLLSKDWSFDIIPCFLTVYESDGRNYYLIPNGQGHWMKTDPRRDRFMVTHVNQNNNVRLLELIRLVKIWNRKSSMVTIPSYLLETMLVDFGSRYMLAFHLPVRFCDALSYLQGAIYDYIYDLKEIQGDLNTLTTEQKDSFYNRCEVDYNLAREAINFEEEGDIEAALENWQIVLGKNFPVE